MKEIPLTKGKVAIVDDVDYEYLSQFKWFVRSKGYAGRRQSAVEDPLRRSLYMHRIISGAKEGEFVDHINMNPLDNRRSNLRICTNTQNVFNRGANSRSKTGVKGVQYSPHRSVKFPYRAVMNFQGKQVLEKSFATLEEAKAAYDACARIYQGEFSRS